MLMFDNVWQVDAKMGERPSGSLSTVMERSKRQHLRIHYVQHMGIVLSHVTMC